MTDSQKHPVDVDARFSGYYPRLKLFLSADIIGSTAYKQPNDLLSDRDGNLDWAAVIQGFYSEAQLSFQSRWDELALAPWAAATTEVDKGPRPVFWKTIGDEVVFWKELTSDIQIWLTLSCWMKTINDLRIYLRKRNNTSLDVKSSVWSAGFPVRNKAVPNEVFRAAGEAPRKPTDALAEFYSRLQNDDLSQTGMVDFIGPGIDVGFRLPPYNAAR